jgi:hypothetical protein
MVFQ